MEKELKRIAVLQTGKVLGVVYAFIGLIMLPFMLIGVFRGSGGAGTMTPMIGMVVLYPVMGFVGGIVAAALYNLVAGWIGGFRFTLE